MLSAYLIYPYPGCPSPSRDIAATKSYWLLSLPRLSAMGTSRCTKEHYKGPPMSSTLHIKNITRLSANGNTDSYLVPLHMDSTCFLLSSSQFYFPHVLMRGSSSYNHIVSPSDAIVIFSFILPILGNLGVSYYNYLQKANVAIFMPCDSLILFS